MRSWFGELYRKMNATSRQDKKRIRLTNYTFFLLSEEYYNEKGITGACGGDTLSYAMDEVIRQGADFSCLCHDSLMWVYGLLDMAKNYALAENPDCDVLAEQRPFLEKLYASLTPFSLGEKMEKKCLYTGEIFAKRIFMNRSVRALARKWERLSFEERRDMVASDYFKGIFNKVFKSDTNYLNSTQSYSDNTDGFVGEILFNDKVLEYPLYKLAAGIGAEEILTKYSCLSYHEIADTDITRYFQYHIETEPDNPAFKGTPLFMLTSMVRQETERLLDIYEKDEAAALVLLNNEKSEEKRSNGQIAPRIYRHLYNKYGLVVKECGVVASAFSEKDIEAMTLTVKDYKSLCYAAYEKGNEELTKEQCREALISVLEKIGKDFNKPDDGIFFKEFDETRYKHNLAKFAMIEKALFNDERFFKSYLAWEEAKDDPLRRRALIRSNKKKTGLIDIVCDALQVSGIEPCECYNITRQEYAGDVNNFEDGIVTLNLPNSVLVGEEARSFFKVLEMILHENWHKIQEDDVMAGKKFPLMASTLYVPMTENYYAYLGNPIEMDAYQTCDFALDLEKKMGKHIFGYMNAVNAVSKANGR